MHLSTKMRRRGTNDPFENSETKTKQKHTTSLVKSGVMNVTRQAGE